MKLERFCSCGAVLKTTVDRRKKAQALIVWADRHSGPGHEETTAAGAEMARMGTALPIGREAAKEGKR